MVRLKIAVIVLGVVGAFWGGRELILSSKAADKPQEITCADLIAKGHGDNAHIILKEFFPCPQWYVYEGKSDKGPYTKVYLPALDKAAGMEHLKKAEAIEKSGGEAPPPRGEDIRVLLKLTSVSDESDLIRRIDVQTLQGMIVNSIESLDSKEKSLLRQGYPQADLDNCYILQVGREPVSRATALLAAVGGGLLGLVGLFWMIRPKIKPSRAEKAPQAPAAAPPASSAVLPGPDDSKNPYRC